MKSCLNFLQCLILAFLAASGSLPLLGAPPPTTTSPAKPEIPKSIFVNPNSPGDGRDPFFPDSLRPYAHVHQTTAAPSLTDLTVRSILPSGDHSIAIINNHAFAPGDEGTVVTKDGRHLTIRCVDVNPEANTVTVEAGGTVSILHFSNKP